MVPLILFFSVALVGVLSVCAMYSVVRKQLAAWRRHRARIRARAAQVAQAARMKVEHEAVLAKLQPRQVAPPAPAPAPTVGLTQVFATLEKSAPFLRLEREPEPSGARSRMAKGSVPIPMASPAPFVVGPRAAPLGPYSSVGTLNPSRPANATPPPPRRASASVPPPIPRRGR